MSEALIDQIKKAIEDGIPDARAEVTPGSGSGHFAITVTAPGFAGKAMVQAHRQVYQVIAHLMQGDAPPVHAIDALRTLAPSRAD